MDRCPRRRERQHAPVREADAQPLAGATGCENDSGRPVHVIERQPRAFECDEPGGLFSWLLGAPRRRSLGGPFLLRRSARGRFPAGLGGGLPQDRGRRCQLRQRCRFGRFGGRFFGRWFAGGRFLLLRLDAAHGVGEIGLGGLELHSTVIEFEASEPLLQGRLD